MPFFDRTKRASLSSDDALKEDIELAVGEAFNADVTDV